MGGTICGAHTPVSYTHLDVYKRQTEYTQTVQEILEKCLVEAARSTPPVITLKMLTRTLLETPNNVASELLRRYDVDIAGLIVELNRQDIDLSLIHI